MAVQLTQNTDGTTTFVSNVNSKIPLVLDDQKGAFMRHDQFIQFFDDFLGDALEDAYSGAGGSDTQALTPAINAQSGGVVRLTCGDSNASAAADASVLTQALNWKAADGGLYLEARVKPISSVEDVAFNIGFTDTLGTTTVEEPFTISGTTVTGVATDAVCFVYDTDATNDTLHAQGVKADTDTAISNTEVALTADAYVKLAIKIDDTGSAYFYVNDVLKASVANAVTASVALTPVVAVGGRTTTSKSLDVDYIFVTSLRA